VTVTVNGEEWHPRVRVPPTVAAQSSANVEINGSYPSTHAGAPNIHTGLDWAWQADEVRACGTQGLIEDD
jgi:hypothetical protein